jgi:hypothetical protein
MNNESTFNKKNNNNNNNKKELQVIGNLEQFKKILDNSDILYNLIAKIDIFAMTLWEIWRYLYDVTNQMYHIIPGVLRIYLNNRSEIEESIMQILPKSIHSTALLLDDDNNNNNNSFSLNDGYKIGQNNNSSTYNKFKDEYLDEICCTCLIIKDTSLNDVIICDKKGCIIPHHLTYRTSNTCLGQPNNHNTVNSVVNKSKNKVGYVYESEESSDITSDLISRLRSEWMRNNV